jgi:phosphatidate cytidylyltransferase
MGNTSLRVIVSVLTIPLILGITVLGGYFFFVFCCCLALLSFYEFSLMAEKKEYHPNLVLGYAAVLALTGNAFYSDGFSPALLLSIVLTVVLIEIFRNRGSAIANIGSTYFGIFYLGFSFASLIHLRIMPISDGNAAPHLIIFLLASIWLCDSAAFFGGTAFGKHRLLERVSPKKSWEGALFGFIFAIIAMYISHLLFPRFLTLFESLIIGAIVGSIGQLGDLAESLLKRDAGVKDSSNIIPGHGGIFDRFDSLIAVAPVVYLYLRFLR